MRALLRHKLFLCVALVFAITGFNAFAAAPLVIAPAFCGPASEKNDAACSHCTSRGTEECTCSHETAPGGPVSICSCNTQPAQNAPMPAPVPLRTDITKDVHVVLATLPIFNLADTFQASVLPSRFALGEAKPIYLWNCILRT